MKTKGTILKSLLLAVNMYSTFAIKRIHGTAGGGRSSTEPVPVSVGPRNWVGEKSGAEIAAAEQLVDFLRGRGQMSWWLPQI